MVVAVEIMVLVQMVVLVAADRLMALIQHLVEQVTRPLLHHLRVVMVERAMEIVLGAAVAALVLLEVTVLAHQAAEQAEQELHQVLRVFL